ncbi:uncharacterized protein LOC123211003 [Mangifera indica]|uniref:uncharacterized protein LOC123211003 n=1 Tax=Mangifera indica TaxID=29780 RepID=UPI001CFB47F5|nr:uncharacterized protein LOC123211003 [Mangifera indica]
MKIISLFTDRVSKIWNGWEVRVLLQLSLLIQIILVIFGTRRKRDPRILIKFVIWSAYLSADWVATVALGNLANIQEGKNSNVAKANNILQAFWAPFLLINLGGPDTITAYSLEDNELWSRHFLSLLVQVGVAVYVSIRAWSFTALTFLSIPVFVTGIVKYGERTFVLRSASSQIYKEALLSANPIAENALMRMETEGFERKIQIKNAWKLQAGHSKRKEFQVYLDAYFLFNRLQYLFSNLLLGLNERTDCYNIIQSKSAKDAFTLVAIELGFMYDKLFTKATLIHSLWGILLRSVSFLSSVVAFILFKILINPRDYPDQKDVSITYSLLAGAVFLEVYSSVKLVFSDRTKLRLIQNQNPRINRILLDAIFYIEARLINRKVWSEPEGQEPVLTYRKRWSESMAQYNLISFCLKDMQAKGLFSNFEKLPYIRQYFQEYHHLTWEYVNDDLKEAIFGQLKAKAERMKDSYTINLCKELLAQRGDYVLEEIYELEELKWSTDELDFDHSLLIWHIATTVCYEVDFAEKPPKPLGDAKESEETKKPADAKPLGDAKASGEAKKPADPKPLEEAKASGEAKEPGDTTGSEDAKRGLQMGKISKCLSNYMMYLLVFCPFMMPKGMGEIRYRDTCAHVKQLFNKQSSSMVVISTQLLEMLYRRSINQSVLSDGCKLAKKLQWLESEKRWKREEKWKMISEVWIEMLTYAANNCGWKDHAQQLCKGGELVTHVWLLMTHLGLSEQYNERERFIV